jgi:hypothetical protein
LNLSILKVASLLLAADIAGSDSIIDLVVS